MPLWRPAVVTLKRTAHHTHRLDDCHPRPRPPKPTFLAVALSLRQLRKADRRTAARLPHQANFPAGALWRKRRPESKVQQPRLHRADGWVKKNRFAAGSLPRKGHLRTNTATAPSSKCRSSFFLGHHCATTRARSEGNGIDCAHSLTPMRTDLSGKWTQNNQPTPRYSLARSIFTGRCNFGRQGNSDSRLASTIPRRSRSAERN